MRRLYALIVRYILRPGLTSTERLSPWRGSCSTTTPPATSESNIESCTTMRRSMRSASRSASEISMPTKLGTTMLLPWRVPQSSPKLRIMTRQRMASAIYNVCRDGIASAHVVELREIAATRVVRTRRCRPLVGPRAARFRIDVFHIVGSYLFVVRLAARHSGRAAGGSRCGRRSCRGRGDCGSGENGGRRGNCGRRGLRRSRRNGLFRRLGCGLAPDARSRVPGDRCSLTPRFRRDRPVVRIALDGAHARRGYHGFDLRYAHRRTLVAPAME